MVYWPNTLELVGVHDVEGVADFVDVKWASKLEELYIYSPAVLGNTLYTGSDERKITAFDTQTGERLWQYEAETEIVSGITIQSGLAYFVDSDPKLVALALDDRLIKWTFPLGKTPTRTVALPVVSADTVYFGGRDKCLHAIDIATGKERWAFQTRGEIRAPAAVSSDDVVYIGSFDNRLYTLEAGNGTMKWCFRTGTHVIHSMPAIANGTVYFGSNDMHLYALDAESGQLKWRFEGGTWLRTFPVANGGAVYFGCYASDIPSHNNYLYALDASTGGVLWRIQTEHIQSGPHIADGRLFLTTLDGLFRALDLETGKECWHFGKEGEGISSPAFSDGAIYIAGAHKTETGNYDHYLYALRTSAHGTTHEDESAGSLAQ